MHIGKIDKDECLVIPLKQLTSINIIEFVDKLAKLNVSDNVHCSFSTSKVMYISLKSTSLFFSSDFIAFLLLV